VTPGDHTLFVAEIIGAWVEEEAFAGTWRCTQGDTPEDQEELCPLLHLGGRQFCVPGKAIEV
jgi:flavin reductase (DIM6/NTAB) family NADH-FMN oxidoreductase RutF